MSGARPERPPAPAKCPSVAGRFGVSEGAEKQSEGAPIDGRVHFDAQGASCAQSERPRGQSKPTGPTDRQRFSLLIQSGTALNPS
eukprot:123679-Prymnesium_polylepis.2